MDQVYGLAATFLAHAKVRFVPPMDTAALESLLVHAWETARAKWPAVALPAEPFVTHLAERLPKAEADSPLEPLLAQLRKDGIDYRGCLYVGLMWGEGGASVVEFNVRLGDPEAQILAVQDDRDWLALIAQKCGLGGSSLPAPGFCPLLLL